MDPSDETAEQAAPRTAADISGPVEALLLLAEEPVTETSLATTLNVPVSVVADCLAELVQFYDQTGRGFELRRVGEGWRYYTRAEHADVVAASVLEGQQSRLSQAALETLAVVAYQQPISRGRISAVRGVNVDGVIRTLLSRGLLEEAGPDQETGAMVFRTTSYFLERMGMRSLDELPELAPHLPDVEELEAELGQLAAVPQPADTDDAAHATTSSDHPDDPTPSRSGDDQ
nr:SMC-Scp complex subunit ScpB [Microlunatus panaciterrae]